MHARVRLLSRLVLETFADAQHPRFAVAMIGLSGFLAGSLTVVAVLLPQNAVIVACLAPLSVLSLCFAVMDWRRPGSSGGGGGGGGGGQPHAGPRPPAPDRWRCPWYEMLWKDQLPNEPPSVIRVGTLTRR